MGVAVAAEMVLEGTAAVVVAAHRSLGFVEPRGWCSMAGRIRMDLCCWGHMAVVAAAAQFVVSGRRLCIHLPHSGIAVVAVEVGGIVGNVVESRLARDRQQRETGMRSVGLIRPWWPCLAGLGGDVVSSGEACVHPGSRCPFVGCG